MSTNTNYRQLTISEPVIRGDICNSEGFNSYKTVNTIDEQISKIANKSIQRGTGSTKSLTDNSISSRSSSNGSESFKSEKSDPTENQTLGTQQPNSIKKATLMSKVPRTSAYAGYFSASVIGSFFLGGIFLATPPGWFIAIPLLGLTATLCLAYIATSLISLAIRGIHANLAYQEGDENRNISTPDYIHSQQSHPAPLTDEVLSFILDGKRELSTFGRILVGLPIGFIIKPISWAAKRIGILDHTFNVKQNIEHNINNYRMNCIAEKTNTIEKIKRVAPKFLLLLASPVLDVTYIPRAILRTIGGGIYKAWEISVRGKDLDTSFNVLHDLRLHALRETLIKNTALGMFKNGSEQVYIPLKAIFHPIFGADNVPFIKQPGTEADILSSLQKNPNISSSMGNEESNHYSGRSSDDFASRKYLEDRDNSLKGIDFE